MSFEKAWDLLKMPIVPHSVTRNEDGTDWEGKFEDPVTGEILPITGGIGVPGGKYGGAFIDRGENERGWPTWRSFIQFDSDDFNEDVHDYDNFLYPTEMGTNIPYRKRGYATALMDFIAQIVQQEHNEKMFESSAQSYDAERFVEAMSDRFAENEKGHRYWVGRNDLMEKSWELMKAFRHPELWHGTLAENAMKIMDEGLEPYSFGAEDMKEAERYADDRSEDHGKAPAILGFDVPKGHTWLRPQDEGYDLGTEYGHHQIREAIPPENIRPFAIGHEGMTGREWSDFLRMLEHLDYLDSFYRRYMDQDAWRRGQ